MSTCRPCSTTQCAVEPDVNLGSLQGVLPTQSFSSSFNSFSNETVYYQFNCSEVTEGLAFTGTLPSWMTIEVGSSRLVGAAGTFRADSNEQANILAQTALNDFAATASANGSLGCFKPIPSGDSS